MSRIVDRQANRANPPALLPSQFCRRCVILPFIDTVFEQLSKRFRSDLVGCIKLHFLMTSVCVKHGICFHSIENAVNFDLSFLDDSIDAVEVEFMRRRSYLLRHKGDSLPNNALDAFLSAKEINTYLSLEVLPQILTTLPVTTATNERSFSALIYLKAYLRSTMIKACLNDTALLYAYRDLNINFEYVIDEFSRKNRRLNFS